MTRFTLQLIAALMTFSAPNTLVLMHSIGLYSAAGNLLQRRSVHDDVDRRATRARDARGRARRR